MYCARCRHVFDRGELLIWAVLPGGTQPVPTCRDDRQCERHSPTYLNRPKTKRVTARMKRVKAMAIRYVAKGVSA